MEALPSIHVEPVYGYGWSVGGESERDVPAAFTVRSMLSQPGMWTGVVTTEGHEFDGLVVTLSQRHREWSGAVNIAVGNEQAIGGFGRLATLPTARRV